ncbi:MAG: PAS domain S-box protein [Chitinispirillaceae bacterium]|nr:PAS domain S-box protein [Chitinispirillaceae bacterium]
MSAPTASCLHDGKSDTNDHSALLNACAGTAFIVQAKSRVIIAANEYAGNAGIVPGTTCFSSWAQRDKPCPWCRAQETIKEGTSCDGEIRLRDCRWNAHWRPISDDLYLHYFITIDDITIDDASKNQMSGEPHSEEIRMENQDDMFRALFTTMTQGVVYFDRKGTATGINPAALRILGVSEEQVIGTDLSHHYWKGANEDGSELPPHLHPVRVALKTGQKIRNIVIGMHNHERKTPVWIRMVAVPLFRAGETEAYQVYVVFDDISLQKKAEENYQILFREMLDGFALHEIICNNQGKPVDYRFLAANPAFERMTTLKAKDIIGKTVLEVMPDTEPYWIQTYGKVALTGEPVTFENYSGTIKKHFSVTAFRPEPGRFACIFSDITTRKVMEDILRQSEETHRALVEGLPDVVMRLDRKCRFLFVSENINQVVSLNATDFFGKTFRDLGFTEDMCEFWEKALQHVVHNEKSFETEFSFDGKNGYTMFNWRLVPEFTPEGNVRSVLSIGRDITRHRLIEDRFQKFFSQISQLAYMVNTDGNIMDVNDVACERLGYDREELIGQPLKMIYAPESLERMEELFMVWRETGSIQNEEMVIVTKGGEQRRVLLNVSAVRDEQGTILHSVSLQTDITELKLYQNEVQRAQKLDSLGVMAGGIAHDFNNLLGGIFGYIDLGNDLAEDPRVKRYLTKALYTIDRARGLTQQLLTFAKGGAPVKRVDHLFPFVEETVRFAMSGSKVFCVFNVEQGLKPCLFDRNQIGQVIDNIVINAQQAMPGGGTLNVTAAMVGPADGCPPTLSPGEYILISISDTGIGIPESHLSRIFDPFYTTKPKGHGLGLATCYSIVSKHGGTIEVKSTSGSGSTFSLYFPVSYEGVTELPDTTTVSHSGTGVVMVMDDEEVMRDTIGGMIAAMGYTPVYFENGASVLDYFRKQFDAGTLPTAMIFDLTIPGGMGGVEALAEIRKIDTTVPVFVASGYADDQVMANPEKYGFAGSIEKPFRKVELEALLKTYFEKK